MVTQRKNATNKNKPNRSSLGCLFWIAFIIVVLGLFLVNRNVIKTTLENTHFLEKVFPKQRDNTAGTPGDVKSVPPAGPIKPGSTVPSVPGTPGSAIPGPSVTPGSPAPSPSAAPGSTVPTGSSGTAKGAQPEPAAPGSATVGPSTGGTSSSGVPTTVKATTPPVKNDSAPRLFIKRTLYFIKIDSDGTLVRTPVVRSLPESDSPMTDALTALIKGPTADEKKRGLESLIPVGTRLLSATVRGSTAYLSFSEEFQFNTYGVEGYAAQLRQIVWTATEFSTIQNVQILIDGRHLDYLGGDGIWIGTPLSRDTL